MELGRGCRQGCRSRRYAAGASPANDGVPAIRSVLRRLLLFEWWDQNGVFLQKAYLLFGFELDPRAMTAFNPSQMSRKADTDCGLLPWPDTTRHPRCP